MSPLIALARSAVENFVKERKIINPPTDLPKRFLDERAGTFVTIERDGNLRGCIGTYLPTKENIAKETIKNAVAAATEDYRFGPIQKEELPHLKYTVYILSKPELVKDPSELDPKKYGILVKTAPITYPNGTDVVFNGHLPYKSGLLLPGLMGVSTAEEQIALACQKSGIDPRKERITLYRFTTEKYN